MHGISHVDVKVTREARYTRCTRVWIRSLSHISSKFYSQNIEGALRIRKACARNLKPRFLFIHYVCFRYSHHFAVFFLFIKKTNTCGAYIKWRLHSNGKNDNEWDVQMYTKFTLVFDKSNYKLKKRCTMKRADKIFLLRVGGKMRKMDWSRSRNVHVSSNLFKRYVLRSLLPFVFLCDIKL